MKITKRHVVRLLVGLLLAPPILIILLGLALYIPTVQDVAVRYVEREASARLGMQVHIAQLRLGFPLDVKLSDVLIKRTPTDTLASLDLLRLSVEPLPLLDNSVDMPHLRAEGIYINYPDSLKYIKARLASLELRDLSANLDASRLTLGYISTDDADIYYRSTDTLTKPEEEPLLWKLLVKQAQLQRTRLAIEMPYNSLFVDGQIALVALNNADIRLETMRVALGEVNVQDGRLSYAVDQLQAKSKTFDPEHIALDSLGFRVRDLLSEGSSLRLMLEEGRLRERSGLAVHQMRGRYEMDSLRMHLGRVVLRTEHSSLDGDVDIPWTMFKGDTTALANISLGSKIGLSDVHILAGDRLATLREYNKLAGTLGQRQMQNPIELILDANGTLQDITLGQVAMIWGGVLKVKGKGQLYHVLDGKRRRGRFILDGALERNANALLALASPELMKRYNLPAGLSVKGNLAIGAGEHQVDFALRHRQASIQLKGHYYEQNNRYKANIRLAGLDVRSFMPHDSIGVVDADVQLSGRGFDFLSRATQSSITARVHRAEYGSMRLSNITADGSLNKGELLMSVNSFNPGLNISIMMDGLLSKQSIYSSIQLDSEDIDLKALGMSEMPLGAKFRLSGELRSDMNEAHSLKAGIEDLHLTIDEDTISPERVDLDINTNQYSSRASLVSGDLKMLIDVGDAPSHLMERMDHITKLAQSVMIESQQPRPMKTRLETIVARLPELTLDIEMGRGNALKDYLARYRIAMQRLEGQIRLRPTYGIEGHLVANDLRQDTMRISCIELDMKARRIPRASMSGKSQPDSMRLDLIAQVDKTRWRRQSGFNFSTIISASLQDALISAKMTDGSGRSQHDATLHAEWDGTHYRVTLPKREMIVAYQTLGINKSNYIAFDKKNHYLSASLDLAGANGSALALTASDIEDKMQQATFSIRNLRLEDYRSAGLPDVSGTLTGEISYERTGDFSHQPIITGDMSVQQLTYEGKKFGHFATALFYEPRNDQSHYITAEVSYQGAPALNINGIYQPRRQDSPLAGTISMTNFPLEIANPFLSEHSMYLEGKSSGTLELAGTLSSPLLRGHMQANKASIELRQYGTTLQLDTIPLRMEGSALHFDRYALRSSVDAEHPIYVDGSVEVMGANAKQTNLALQADETVVLNQSEPKSENQLVYGRLVASADLRLTGKADALKVRGKLGILSGTSCNYIMREGKLDATDRTSGLVTYVDFADTLFARQPIVEAQLGGIDMNVAIGLDPSVRFGIDLTADGKDYMRMQGGGNLQLRYLPYGDIRLTGRYEMSGGGTMHYTMPVVGGKLFKIDPSGYVRFDGEMQNPYIDFVATQTVRASSGESGGAKTNFVVSIKAKDKVENINLSFDLSAPESLTVQNKLAGMTPEERGKQAIGLLATGTFLAAEGKGANFNFDNALSSLLQNQINAAAGSLLQGTDLSLGMEMGDGTSGAKSTNYTYSFSRRFYNDRIRVVIGGKIQTGNAVTNREQTLIDNVALEYQIDKVGERYLQLYHNRITDNVLEGEHTETGAAYLIRRKLRRLSDLFDFRSRKKKAEKDSLKLSLPIGVPFALPIDSTKISK